MPKSKPTIVMPESKLTQLLLHYGVSPEMQAAACSALSKREKPLGADFRADIILAGVFAAGVYIALSVAGIRANPYLVILAGGGLAFASRLLERSGISDNSPGCQALIFLTRYGIDFQQLSRDIFDSDPELAQDLKSVLVVGVSDPAGLSDYSILHLWECVRIRAKECEQAASWSSPE
jgi:hypothetical protein